MLITPAKDINTILVQEELVPAGKETIKLLHTGRDRQNRERQKEKLFPHQHLLLSQASSMFQSISSPRTATAPS